MARKRVVIVVEGGLVQSVAADDPNTEVILIDWDHIKEELPEHPDIRFLADLGKKEVDRYLREAKAQLRDLKKS